MDLLADPVLLALSKPTAGAKKSKAAAYACINQKSN